MDCKEFRDNHSLYVDQMCSALEENEMREHALSCAKCARHDTVVRRSLLLVRNLPPIEPSADFRARLAARLREPAVPLAASTRFRPSYKAFAAVAAGVAFVTVLAGSLLMRAEEPLRMSPVVASLPQAEASQLATPAFVATVPTGMTVWPAIMVASQAQIHLVAAELASER